MSTLTIEKVSKHYGKKQVLKDISVSFEGGKLYGLLGRNGAGKTTLIDMITGKQAVSSGQITMDGRKAPGNDWVQGHIFAMGEQNIYPEDMSVKGVFSWMQLRYSRFNWDEAYRLSRIFHLDLKHRFCKLSTGQQSLVKLVCGLALDVDIKIFDEPVLGLDAVHRDIFYKELLKSYAENPCTVILSTHLIEEVSDLLERVVVMDEGEIKVDSAVEDLLREAYCVSGPRQDVEVFVKGRPVLETEFLQGFASATVRERLTEDIRRAGEQVGLQFAGVSLNRLFIDLTKEAVEQ